MKWCFLLRTYCGSSIPGAPHRQIPIGIVLLVRALGHLLALAEPMVLANGTVAWPAWDSCPLIRALGQSAVQDKVGHGQPQASHEQQHNQHRPQAPLVGHA